MDYLTFRNQRSFLNEWDIWSLSNASMRISTDATGIGYRIKYWNKLHRIREKQNREATFTLSYQAAASLCGFVAEIKIQSFLFAIHAMHILRHYNH